MKHFVRNILKYSMRMTPLRGFLRYAAQAGLLSPALTMRLPVEGTFAVKIAASEGFKYRSYAGDQTGRVLYWHGKGGIDPETLDYFDEHIRGAEVFADIGANVGHFSLHACAVNPDVRVYAFEPVKRTHAHLQENIGLNGWLGRCTLTQAAMGAKSGETQFHIPYDDFPFSASLNRDGFNNIKGELVTVNVSSFDDFFEGKQLPDVIKIDVEGFEPDVLRGMKASFARAYRPVIILECNPGGPDREITDILTPLGYQFLQLRDTGPRLSKTITAEEKDHFRNWAALPPKVLAKAA